MTTKVKRWKKPIIRWALRQLKPLLPVLRTVSYDKLEEFGIEDLQVNEHTGDIAIYLD